VAKALTAKWWSLCGLVIAAALLILPFLTPSVLANSLVISPYITEVEISPGTTARVIFFIENGLDSNYTFHFSIAEPLNLREDFANLPDSTWIKLDPEHIALAPGERGWVEVEVAIPSLEGIKGQKWQADISIACEEQPLLSSNAVILITAGKPSPESTNWAMVGGLVLSSVVGVVLWNHHHEQKRNEWPTGLKTKHWIK